MQHGTHVVVADSEKMLILRNQGDADIVDLGVIEHSDVAIPPSREIEADRAGRYHAPSGTKGNMGDTNWHDLEKTQRARALGLRVNRLAEEVPGPIVVVADASTLGAMRKQLNPATEARIVREIARDLTNHPVPRIERLLGEA